MKKTLKFPYWLSFVLTFLTISCSKHHDTPAVDCITRIDVSHTSTVPTAQMDSISTLFSLNSLSTAGLQFYFFMSGNFGAPGFSGIQEQVAANVFYNDLPVFAYDQYFIFNAGIYQPTATSPYTGQIPGPDTTTRQTLDYLRTAYLDHYQQDTLWPPTAISHPVIPGTAYRDSCLLAELGYIDAATFSKGTVPYGLSLIKVWKVSPLSGGYPMVYVVDSTGVCFPVSPILI